MRGITITGAVTLVLLVGGTARAAVIYNDGGTHTVNGPSTEITVTNGTTLNVEAGASVVQGQNGLAGIFAGGSGVSLVVSGGNVTGGPTGMGGNPGILAFSGASLTITGGQVNSGMDGSVPNDISSDAVLAASAGPISISGGTLLGFNGLRVADFESPGGPISISGGTFTGVDSVFTGATGARFELYYPTDVVMISGGTFSSASSSGRSLALILDSGAQAMISGGTFDRSMGVFLTNGGSVTFLGSGWGYSGGTFPGVLTGTLLDGTRVDSAISMYGGTLVSIAPDRITFMGPTVPAPEPASIVMMSLGLAGVAGLAWRRRR